MDVESGRSYQVLQHFVKVNKFKKSLLGRLFRLGLTTLLFVCLFGTAIWIFKKLTILGEGVEISWEGSNVVPLTASNFTSFIFDIDKSVLVNFYAPWCPHCQQFVPNFIQLSKLLENDTNIVLAAIDAWKYSEIAESFQIKGFPTILLFPLSQKRTPIVYTGWRRNVESILEFLQSQTL
ncbi:Protein disulfide-isomerase A3 [Galdieria sulphuraria]|uniref:Protein disulfide isomerase family A n=1 Tax=Galdieria sulphuraria TaxID=130081 RepID=M2XUA8_GALSU|nr:protein disulfide isomerase family A [Galdieria sulphuraria]EME26999.1 protein disulfide isomerase family A [Galdieria sulphuraria]GJD10990.1 Protein disulfide-isomerase A3 [Galdieria sulphuraria]|eukprot:XP_005703519.1 protein disulfide isomerase family A [Galdieria sulphuraria]